MDEPVADATANSPSDNGDTDVTVGTIVMIPNGQDVQNKEPNGSQGPNMLMIVHGNGSGTQGGNIDGSNEAKSVNAQGESNDGSPVHNDD